MHKKNVTLLLLMLISIGLYAQKRTLQGVVLTAESKQPLEGATITVNKTSLITTTDQQGKFQLELPEGKAILSISFVGRETVELDAKSDNNITILLKASNATLEEVVAVAYTTVKDRAIPVQ